MSLFVLLDTCFFFVFFYCFIMLAFSRRSRVKLLLVKNFLILLLHNKKNLDNKIAEDLYYEEVIRNSMCGYSLIVQGEAYRQKPNSTVRF